MIATIVIFIFCILIVWLLIKYPFNKAKAPEDFRKLMPFFAIIALFLLFNSLLALAGYAGLNQSVKQAPVETLQSLSELKQNDGLILVGVVSHNNSAFYSDYAAYMDDSHLWSPIELWIKLGGGEVAISNNTYQATNWPMDAMQYAYLLPGQPVVVVGFLERATSLVDASESLEIRADVLYAGSFDDFRTRSRGKSWLAGGIAFTNLVALVVVLLFPLRECVIKMKKQSIS